MTILVHRICALLSVACVTKIVPRVKTIAIKEYISCETCTAYMVKNAIPTYKWKLYSVHGKAGYIPTHKWHLYSAHGKEAVFLHTSDTYTAYMVKRTIFLRITEREAQMYHIIVMWIDQIAIIFRNFDITNKKVDI